MFLVDVQLAPNHKHTAGSAKQDVKGKSCIAGQTGGHSKASADGSVAEHGNAAEDDWMFGGGSKAGVMSNSHERELLEASAAGVGKPPGAACKPKLGRQHISAGRSYDIPGNSFKDIISTHATCCCDGMHA